MAIQYSLVVFTVLTGIAGWLFACVAVNSFIGKTRKVDSIAAIVALVLLVVGGLASVTHLSHPDRILGALGHPTSGIFVEALLTGLAIVFIVAYIFLAKRNNTAGKLLAVLGAAAGVALSFMAGLSYVMSSIPAWNTVMLPVAYCSTAALVGIGFYLALAGMKREITSEDSRVFLWMIVVASVIAIASTAVFFAGASKVGVAGWILCTAIGGIAPLAISLVAMRQQSKITACALAGTVAGLVGCIGVRVLMWLAGESLYSFIPMVM